MARVNTARKRTTKAKAPRRGRARGKVVPISRGRKPARRNPGELSEVWVKGPGSRTYLTYVHDGPHAASAADVLRNDGWEVEVKAATPGSRKGVKGSKRGAAKARELLRRMREAIERGAKAEKANPRRNKSGEGWTTVDGVSFAVGDPPGLVILNEAGVRKLVERGHPDFEVGRSGDQEFYWYKPAMGLGVREPGDRGWERENPRRKPGTFNEFDLDGDEWDIVRNKFYEEFDKAYLEARAAGMPVGQLNWHATKVADKVALPLAHKFHDASQRRRRGESNPSWLSRVLGSESRSPAGVPLAPTQGDWVRHAREEGRRAGLEHQHTRHGIVHSRGQEAFERWAESYLPMDERRIDRRAIKTAFFGGYMTAGMKGSERVRGEDVERAHRRNPEDPTRELGREWVSYISYFDEPKIREAFERYGVEVLQEHQTKYTDSPPRTSFHVRLPSGQVGWFKAEGAASMARARERGHPRDNYTFIPAPGRRSNPESAAADLSHDFHGRPAETITTVRDEVKTHEWLTGLGTLTEIEFRSESGRNVTLGFDAESADPTLLSSSEDGRQLYLVGGDQSVDLKSFGMDGRKWVRDSMVLGTLSKITYRTQKGFDNFETIDYYHRLGEETKVRPKLIYDTLNRELSIAGGQYSVERPGIIN